jgi:predicted CXXCH cytochrome family protein
MLPLLFVSLAPSAGSSPRLFISGEDAGYIEPAACASCHREIYETYRRTGMGRSFYRPALANMVEDSSRRNTYYHEASDQHYTMIQRGGRYFQRRHQIGPDGGEINVVEKEIDFVLGSGNHSRTYLHKTPNGQLEEMPLAWYAEKGGYWAMNPGYDRPDHLDFRRKLDRECFFCHNAYPQIEATPGAGERELFLRGAVPEGIDCQRCHGPGRTHVQSVGAGRPLDAIRKSIVNPARLSPQRQLELCFQCHLESTSHKLPYSLRRFDRGFFSFRPGEPLENYALYFDHASGTGYDDKFEIAHAAYRLLKSSCFLKSNGALTCTTCHDPHQAAQGEQATRRYVRVCQSCHAAAHNAAQNCVTCHMPRRRTDDVVHVVMTDHFIQRNRPSRDLLAPIREKHDTAQSSYQGEVVLLYPPLLPATAQTELYLATAQVVEGSNFAAGIPRLRKAIDTHKPPQAEFYFELANAYSKTGQDQKAIPYFEEALRRNPRFPAALINYSTALTDVGRAVKVLESAPHDAATLNALGSAHLRMNWLDQAVTTLHRAVRIDSDLPEVYVNLGIALSRKGDRAEAIDAFQSAIRLSPSLSAAHSNLANLLDARGDVALAQYHFRKAIAADPTQAVVHYNYGLTLVKRKMYEEGESELSTALELDPRMAEAATSLAMALEGRGKSEAAIEYYRRALQIKPSLMATHFNLGLALLRQGSLSAARQQFEAVVQSDPNDYQAHLHLGSILMSEGDHPAAAVHLRRASQSPRPDVRAAALRALEKIRH